ncbi:hypothetical protein LCGC14_1984170 [marine sediment metagenome]|uniref:Uncharacterized protein n=1 Tax=marine sediment metagenome TaxID=412755 RepID=A0A0F9HL84_9ZZZZ
MEDSVEMKLNIKREINILLRRFVLEHPMKNKEIAELAVKKFNGNTKATCIAWYKGKLKKQEIKIIV